MSTAAMETSEIISRNNNVSKLDRLNARVGRLLSAAVNEVLDVVRETVLEYQEKTARTQRENERLRKRLREALENLEKERERSRLDSISLTLSPPSPQPRQTVETGETGESLTSVKKEDALPEPNQNAEAETVCDLRVALTLANKCPESDHKLNSDRVAKLIQNGAHQPDRPPTDCRPILATKDVKIEPVTSDESYSINQTTTMAMMPQVRSVTENQRSNAISKCEEDEEAVSAVGPHGLLSTFGRCQSGGKVVGRATVEGRQNPHLQRLPRVENHACQVCGKTFSRMANLRIHQRCHTGERPHRCLVCGRSFRQTGDLSKHRRVHTGEKPYCCVQCGKRFNRSENLKRHQKIHDGGSSRHRQPPKAGLS